MTTKCGCASATLLILGVALLAAGLILYFESDRIIHSKVKQSVELKEGTLVFKNWQRPTSPLFMQYFVFNVTNPDKVLAGEEIPDLQQIGPYSYKEIRTNEVRNYSSDRTEIIFMPNRTYIFDPQTSCVNCSEDDTFTTVNVPLLTTAIWLKETNYKKTQGALCWLGLTYLVFDLLSKEQLSLFHTKKVKEVLWGYEDPLLEKILKAHNVDKNCAIPKGLNAFVQLQYNNTYYGISGVNTGRRDINKLEQYTMWRNERKLSWWSDKYANMINGTDGSQFKPGLSKSDILYAFVPDICRSIYVKYTSTVEYKGIKLYRYNVPDEVYLSGDVYPPNKGFCVPPRCLPTGLLNLTRCQPQNPPIAVSPPHFYQSNKSLAQAVKGLHPVANEHETFLDVEPTTGITMRAKRRIQVNVHLKPVDYIEYTNKNFTPVFLPIMYVNEEANIDDHDAAEFKRQVYDQMDLLDGAEFGLMGIGSLLVVITTLVFVYLIISSKNKGEKSKPIQTDTKKTYGAVA